MSPEEESLARVIHAAHHGTPEAWDWWGEGLDREAALREARAVLESGWAAAVKAAALREFAAQLRNYYPEDPFFPLSSDRQRALGELLDAYDYPKDAINAEVFGRAAAHAERLAAELVADAPVAGLGGGS